MGAAEKLSEEDIQRIAERVRSLMDGKAQPTLVSKTTALGLLGIGASTLDRAVRAGCPVEYFNGRRRFDVNAVREWFKANKSRTATFSKPRKDRDVDVERELRELGRKVRG